MENLEQNLKDAIPGDMDIGGKVSSYELALKLIERIQETWQGQLLADFIHFTRIGEYEKSIDLLKQFPVFFSVLFLSTFLLALLIVRTCFSSGKDDSLAGAKTEEPAAEEAPDPRDFTLEQLREHDGVKNKSIYVALKVY